MVFVSPGTTTNEGAGLPDAFFESQEYQNILDSRNLLPYYFLSFASTSISHFPAFSLALQLDTRHLDY